LARARRSHVSSVAIGFGALKLVQDIITGAFIQVENAMTEGRS
jgi:small conductance mechanosensitive channel